MTESIKKYRADELLVIKKLCTSRSQARDLILRGLVLLQGTPFYKPGKSLPLNSPLTLKRQSVFVSRAGEKLHAFLQNFSVHIKNKNALDIGASTGGFTDCLLQNGAKSVTCIDVGHSQLHPSLRNNPKVHNLEKINARALTAERLPFNAYPIITMDVSFISITKILPNLWKLLSINGLIISLVKPQFESTPRVMGQFSGVIRSKELQENILKTILQFSLTELKDSKIIGSIPSPIKGSDGNQEFIIGILKNQNGQQVAPL